MGMAYSKAWRLIGAMERRLGFLLIERKVGGQWGGGSNVTSQGEDLMKSYARFQKDAKDALERIYQRHFRGLEKGVRK